MIKRMAEQWIIRVQGKDYGPADLATLHEWKSEGRVLASNPARLSTTDNWKTAAEIPGLFQAQPPVQVESRDQGSPITDRKSQSRPPTRNIPVETFRIYLRGFFQFLGLSLLSVVPILCAEFTSSFIDTAPGVNLDLRTLVAAMFGLCMFVVRIVLVPIYIAGIQILTAELASGSQIGFFSVLNGAVKYWPRVAGLCVFVYGVFLLITAFGIAVVSVMLAGAVAGSIFWIVLALVLTAVQIWLFCRFFVFTLFWQQFSVLENLPAFEALQQSGRLAHSGGDLPWYQRPLWRAAVIASVWIALLIGIAAAAAWPRFAAEWPAVQDYFNQLRQAQDPQAVLQKLNTSLQTLQASHGIDYRALALNIGERIVQPLLGIAFVVLYLDSKNDRES